MPKNAAHPNNIHSCVEEEFEFAKHICSLTTVFSAEEFVSVYDFFVLHAPVLRNAENKDENEYGQRALRYYGWVGTPNMSKLERMLLKAARLSCFTILRSDTIDETLLSMRLKDCGCVAHPRAILKQKHSVKILEDGTVQISDGETRMECLFRHVRNALAHNRTFAFSNSMIMLQDEDEDNHKMTARLLIPSDTLRKWKNIIMKEEGELTSNKKAE